MRWCGRRQEMMLNGNNNCVVHRLLASRCLDALNPLSGRMPAPWVGTPRGLLVAAAGVRGWCNRASVRFSLFSTACLWRRLKDSTVAATWPVAEEAQTYPETYGETSGARYVLQLCRSATQRSRLRRSDAGALLDRGGP